MQARIDSLNASLREYFRDAHESLDYARRQVISPLEDARGLLEMKSQAPDYYFLPMAEMFLKHGRGPFPARAGDDRKVRRAEERPDDRRRLTDVGAPPTAYFFFVRKMLDEDVERKMPVFT